MKKLIVMLALFGAPSFADTSAVKMSTNGICHSTESQYYNRVKNFTAFDSIDACVDAGGRLPR